MRRGVVEFGASEAGPMEPLNRASDDEDPRTETEDVDYDSDMGSDSSNSFPEGIGEELEKSLPISLS